VHVWRFGQGRANALGCRSQGGHNGEIWHLTLEAKIGKEHEVAAFLQSALPLVEAEPGTVSWFAIRVSSTTFAIFDVFNDEAGRDTHLAGEVAKALMAKAPELFAQPPKIGKVDVLAAKLG
jgi:quinol monooxygenase YgiN